MSNPVRAFVILVAIAAGALTIVSGMRPAEDPSQTDGLVGAEAPAFTLPTLDGPDEVSLSDFGGEVLVLDFWASHCAPCRRAIPHVERLARRYADEGVAVLSVNVDFPDGDRDETVRRFVRDVGINAPVALDDGRTAYAYGAQRIPLLVMVDRDGVIRRVYRGYTEYNRLADGLESLLDRES